MQTPQDASTVPGLMSREEASAAVLAFAFGGALGNTAGKGVVYSHLSTDETTTIWIAGLQDFEVEQPVDRYLITIDRTSKKVTSHSPITVSRTECEECVLAATGHHVKAITRSVDGALSISYRVSIVEDDAIEYLLQLRFFADVTSVYMIPGELERQTKSRFGRQITRFIHGSMAGSLYAKMTHTTRLAFVRNMAKAYAAIWDLPIPRAQWLIGELRATSADPNNRKIVLHVGPDRAYGFTEPFTSVRDHLRAFIRFHLTAFEAQDGVEPYKQRYLARVKAFVEAGMHNIPEIVESIPIVAQHCDLGPHNVILKATDAASPMASEIAAVINWEFVASTPFMSATRSIEMLFREFAQNDFGPELPFAGELRQAFWDAIPKWKAWYEHEATVVYLEWYRFALFLNPAEPDDDIDEQELWNVFWAENVRVTEGMLRKYGGGVE